jgi:hypothetical protein
MPISENLKCNKAKKKHILESRKCHNFVSKCSGASIPQYFGKRNAVNTHAIISPQREF